MLQCIYNKSERVTDMLDKSDLKAIQEMVQMSIQESLKPINKRFDEIDERLDKMQEDTNSQFMALNSRLNTMQIDINAIRKDIRHISNRETQILDIALENNKVS